jgi:hypothetical protein
MGGAGGGEAPGLGFDHRLEGIAAQGPLLLEVEADLRDLFRGQGLVEDAAPDLLALRLAVGETLPDRMRAKARSRALAEIRRTAGPAVRRWIVGQPRADRIELDVPAKAAKQLKAKGDGGN